MVFPMSGNGNPAIAQQLLRDDSVAILYDKSNEVFSSSTWILSELLEDYKNEVEYHHDPDWDQFPEIGEYLKQQCNKDHCITVAVIASRSVYAVGASGGWKGREAACRVGLALALSEGDHSVLEGLASKIPVFGAFCASQNLLDSHHVPQAAPQHVGKKGGHDFAVGGGAVGVCDAPPPRIELTTVGPDSEIVAQGLPECAYAVETTKASKEYFCNAHNILSELVEDIGANVVFHDDPDWKIIPEVGEAVHQTGMEDNCYCTAVAESFSAWGVGVGAGWKARESAAKLALAIAIAFQTEKLEQLAESYPELARLLIQGGLLAPATEQPVQPCNKRRRGS